MDPLAPLLAALHAEGRLRIWSLVITIMGDAVQPRGGRISLARLQALVARLGVEPGALRTALSRLVADGWLDRDRIGRTSTYRLSNRGLSEFAPAAARVYAPPAEPPGLWSLVLMPDGTADAPKGIALGGGFRLVPGSPPTSAELAVEGALYIAANTQGQLCPPDQREALGGLIGDIDALQGVALAAHDAMAARILLIHRWRRLVLRYPELPDALLPKDLAGARARVASAYLGLLPASETWLDTGLAGDATRLPAPDRTLARRFVSARAEA